VETISRVELIQQLTLTPKQFDAAVKAAGLQPQNAYSLDDAELIKAAAASKPKGGQMTRKTQEQARGELTQVKSELATQSAIAGRQEGANLATITTKALIKGYTETSIQHLQTLTQSVSGGRVALTGDQAEEWIYEAVDGADFLSLDVTDLVL
jgi:hypothetical protein